MNLGRCSCGVLASLIEYEGEWLCPTCRLVRKRPEEAKYHHERHRPNTDADT